MWNTKTAATQTEVLRKIREELFVFPQSRGAAKDLLSAIQHIYWTASDRPGIERDLLALSYEYTLEHNGATDFARPWDLAKEMALRIEEGKVDYKYIS